MSANYFCRACSERLCAANGPTRIIAGVAYCKECGDELAEGKVGPPPKPLYPAGDYGALLDDTGPWQDNAIRQMEDA